MSPATLAAWAGALTRRVTETRTEALLVALALAVVVAALDYATGYELRLATLYLIPLALATWGAGWQAGVLMVALTSLFWLLSFRSAHPYSVVFYFYWEGLVRALLYLAFVALLTRLRSALTRADERFARVLGELYSAVYVADQDNGEILYANQSLERLTHVDPLLLNAAQLGQRLGLGDDVAERLPPTRGTPESDGFASREVRNPASGRWYLVRAGQIPWNSGRRVKLHMITDISEQKRVSALKQQHQDMLHKTARLASLAEIASSLAHEINQPLMAIASYNEACLRMLAASPTDQQDVVIALQRCREQALRAGRIISRIREFIRSKHPSPSLCDINALINEALELLEAQLEEHAVTTQLSLSSSPLTIRADQTLLVQVILNLLQNAIDAMATCAPQRRCLSVDSARSADGAIVVGVADRGDGIPAALGDALFTPFSTTKAQGLGLGLSICRSVVEAHGGRIWHEANPGGGSRFHFTLPAQDD